MREILSELDRWQREGEEIALATLLEVRGSAPRLPGARLAVTRSGRMAGSVSGGCVETDLFERAMMVLDSGEPAIASYGIADDLAFEVGLSCGGSIDVLIERFAPDAAWDAVRAAVEAERPAVLALGVAPPAMLGRRLAVVGAERTGGIDETLDALVLAEATRLLRDGSTTVLRPQEGEAGAAVFVEALPPPPRLYIVGATHAAIPLSRMAREVGFTTTVIDARSIFATPERFPAPAEVIRAWPDEALERVTLDEHSYVVVLSHDPKFDVPTVAHALRTRATYIGAMGSPPTHQRRAEELRRLGFSEEEIARVRTPVGLDIGARTPEEIALAILAEMVAARHARTGSSLSARRRAADGSA